MLCTDSGTEHIQSKYILDLYVNNLTFNYLYDKKKSNHIHSMDIINWHYHG